MSKWDHATTAEGGADDRGDTDAIAKRAYELFLQRGSTPGNEVDDWLQAETELRSRAQKAGGDSDSDSDSRGQSNDQQPRTAGPGRSDDRHPATDDSGRSPSRERPGGRRGTRQQPNH